MHPNLDSFIHIIQENNLNPAEIDKVVVTPCAVSVNRLWLENELRTEDDFGFHAPYLIACAAHRIKSKDFHNPEIRQDPEIRQFMEKVTVSDKGHDDYGLAILKDPVSLVTSVEVWANGESFKHTSQYPSWSWHPEKFRATDEDLVGKFSEIVSRFLPSRKVEKAADSLLNLEEIENVNDVIEMLNP